MKARVTSARQTGQHASGFSTNSLTEVELFWIEKRMEHWLRFGTVFSHIDIVRAIAPGQAYQTLLFVRPGGDILLHVEGSPKVERVLRIIDAVELAQIDPAEVSPDYWREVHNRLAARLEPHRYTSTRHRAWLARREADR
jgi:hypothetical protein